MTATFTALERSLVGNEMVEAGTTGVRLPEGTLPGPNMKPENDEAQAMVAGYEASNKERLARMQAENPNAIGGSADAFAAAVAQAIKESNAVHAAQMAEMTAMMAKLVEAQTGAPKGKAKAADSLT